MSITKKKTLKLPPVGSPTRAVLDRWIAQGGSFPNMQWMPDPAKNDCQRAPTMDEIGDMFFPKGHLLEKAAARDGQPTTKIKMPPMPASAFAGIPEVLPAQKRYVFEVKALFEVYADNYDQAKRMAEQDLKSEYFAGKLEIEPIKIG